MSKPKCQICHLDFDICLVFGIWISLIPDPYNFMKILHIIRDKGHELAISTALAQATLGGQGISQEVAILLIHDAVLTNSDTLKGLKVFALKDDVEARGVGGPLKPPPPPHTKML